MPDPRQRLPTTNHGPAATRTREYQPDPRRAQPAGPPPAQPTTQPQPHISQRQRANSTLPDLTNAPPYQLRTAARRLERLPNAPPRTATGCAPCTSLEAVYLRRLEALPRGRALPTPLQEVPWRLVDRLVPGYRAVRGRWRAR